MEQIFTRSAVQKQIFGRSAVQKIFLKKIAKSFLKFCRFCTCQHPAAHQRHLSVTWPIYESMRFKEKSNQWPGVIETLVIARDENSRICDEWMRWLVDWWKMEMGRDADNQNKEQGNFFWRCGHPNNNESRIPRYTQLIKRHAFD